MKRTSMLLVAILSVFVLSVNALAADEADMAKILALTQAYEYDPQQMEQAQMQNNSGVQSNASFDGSYKSQLNEDCKKIYEAIDNMVSGVLSEKKGCNLVHLDNGELYYSVFAVELENTTKENYSDYVDLALSAYINDHPLESSTFNGYQYNYPWDYYELMDEIMPDWNFIYEHDGVTHVGVASVRIYAIDDNVVARANELSAAIGEFEKKFTTAGIGNKSALEQYRYIHDFLCENCSYNDDALNPKERGEPGFEAHMMAHRAYGALVGLEYGSDAGRGSVVCEGYAEAFQLLCQWLHLPCATVDGDGGMSGATLENNHEWNIIQPYDTGVWYAVDVTWDDQDSNFNNLEVFQRTLDSFSTWTYQYFADNRYFTEHEGNPKQDHAAMSQLRYSTSDNVALEAPALTADRIAEVDDWVAASIILYVRADAKTSDLNDVIFTLRYNHYTADTVILRLAGNMTADAQVEVSDGKYYQFCGNIDVEDLRILRDESYTGTMFSVAAGGMLDFYDLTLDGNSKVVSTGPILALGAGQENNRVIAELCRCTVTGSRGAYAVTAAENAKLYLSDDVTFADNLINNESADIDLADSALLHFNYHWDGGKTWGSSDPVCPWVWDDEKGVYVSFFCLEDDAALFCATYTEEGGKQVGIESTEYIKGFHTYYFPKLAENYDTYRWMRFFALRNGTFEPLF